jgi:hypothetical protein
MDDICKYILTEIGLIYNNISELNNIIILRNDLLNINKYIEIKPKIMELKKHLSSSFLTCLHRDALDKQKFPLLNLVRQVLNIYKFKLIPIRKSDGYTKDGKKIYKRYFQCKYINDTSI